MILGNPYGDNVTGQPGDPLDASHLPSHMPGTLKGTIVCRETPSTSFSRKPMDVQLRNLSSGEVRLLLGISEKLSRGQDQDTLRREIAQDLLRLLKADFLASFIWNPDRQVFEKVVFLNMTPENIARYQTYYRFRDPITPSLQKKRRATLVCEVMPQEELERTEFFNDFLMADGLHHGINLYAYDGDLNIGDLRIWRAKDRPCFERREAALLDAILPHFRNALRNARVLGRTSERAGLWEGLLDISREALFLFDESGTLCFRNRTAGLMERKLPEKAYAALFARVRSLVGGDLSQTRWGPFFLSVQRILPPHNPRPYAAVTAYREERTGLGRERLQGTFHLSPRETDIALLVCKGLTDREIASALGIAFSTVRTHLKHLFQKLEATTRSELIFVLLEGIVDISF